MKRLLLNWCFVILANGRKRVTVVTFPAIFRCIGDSWVYPAVIAAASNKERWVNVERWEDEGQNKYLVESQDVKVLYLTIKYQSTSVNGLSTKKTNYCFIVNVEHRQNYKCQQRNVEKTHQRSNFNITNCLHRLFTYLRWRKKLFAKIS